MFDGKQQFRNLGLAGAPAGHETPEIAGRCGSGVAEGVAGHFPRGVRGRNSRGEAGIFQSSRACDTVATEDRPQDAAARAKRGWMGDSP